MTIREAYALATASSSITVTTLHRTAADYLIASGWTPSRMGWILRRVQAEWDAAIGRRRMSEADFKLFVNALQTLPTARRMVTDWCARKGIAKPEEVAGAALRWWLDNTCQHCHGRGFDLIPGAPVLGSECRHCNGTGRRKEPANAYRVIDMFEECVGYDTAKMRGYLMRGA